MRDNGNRHNELKAFLTLLSTLAAVLFMMLILSISVRHNVLFKKLTETSGEAFARMNRICEFLKSHSIAMKVGTACSASIYSSKKM